jgi:glycosyltransferase involved in cell wall biosynthesis
MTGRPLRIGLNLMFLGEASGGVGRLSHEVLSALAMRSDAAVTAYLSRDAPASIRTVPGAERVRFVELPVAQVGSRPHMLAEYLAVPALAIAHRLDVLHSPGNAGPVLIPGVACAVSLHDVIWRHAGDDWADAGAQRAMERVAVPTVRRADRVLTGSDHSADDVSRELGVPRDRISVVSNGVRVDPGAPRASDAELRATYDLGDAPVLLCIAQKRPYKNQATLVHALARMQRRDALLVLPGAATAYEEELRALAAELGVAERVRYPSWISDAELEGLYALASAVVLPSKLEGFGLPVLEAMGRGTPVLCSPATSLGEVAGDAALLADPDDIDAFAAGADRLLSDAELRARLIAAGHDRAAEFTWARVGERSMDAYRRTVDARRDRRGRRLRPLSR